LSGEHFGLQDVEKSTLIRVFRTIPNSFEAVSNSINQGGPVVELAPKDAVSRALKEWAENLAPHSMHSDAVEGNGGPIAALRKFMGFGQ
jgi:pilus assembly protein CpaE